MRFVGGNLQRSRQENRTRTVTSYWKKSLSRDLKGIVTCLIYSKHTASFLSFPKTHILPSKMLFLIIRLPILASPSSVQALALACGWIPMLSLSYPNLTPQNSRAGWLLIDIPAQ